MGKGATGRGERRKRWGWGGGEEGVRGGEISQMGKTKAIVFTDSYMHMECLG